MKRIESAPRPSPWPGTGEAKLVPQDIFHVWPHGWVEDGVRWTSRLFVYLRDEPKNSQRVKVQLWVAGEYQGERSLGWNEEWYVEPKKFGLASVVVEGNFPVAFFWELSPGRAE